MANLFFVRSRREIEIARRTKVAVYAYAYEVEGKSIVPDSVFDEECSKINLTVDTGRPELDAWFRREFAPYTGSWIHAHPDLTRIKELYDKHYDTGS